MSDTVRNLMSIGSVVDIIIKQDSLTTNKLNESVQKLKKYGIHLTPKQLRDRLNESKRSASDNGAPGPSSRVTTSITGIPISSLLNLPNQTDETTRIHISSLLGPPLTLEPKPDLPKFNHPKFSSL